MKILINSQNLIPDDSWQEFRKVRSVIENDLGDYAICFEAGKCIFPGGKCEKDEDELQAIQREIKEETGIELQPTDFHKVLELETMYEDYLDFRINTIIPRHTITTYFYAKTDKKIDTSRMNLTDDEIEKEFKVAFVNKDTLFKMLLEDHSNAMNGKFFDEENRIVLDNILKNSTIIEQELGV